MHFDSFHAVAKALRKLPALLIALAALAVGSADAEICLTLKNAFIEEPSSLTIAWSTIPRASPIRRRPTGLLPASLLTYSTGSQTVVGTWHS